MRQFCLKWADKSVSVAIFKHVNFVVDKLHITGHKGEECLRNCRPNLFPELQKVNTVVVEQVNFILDKYKYSIRLTNKFRFNLLTMNCSSQIQIIGNY